MEEESVPKKFMRMLKEFDRVFLFQIGLAIYRELLRREQSERDGTKR